MDAAHKAEIEAAAADPAATRAALEARYHRLGSPIRTAEQFGILDIIDPRAVLEHDRSRP